MFYQTSFSNFTEQELSITDIQFSHPLYQNVFEKNVTNFQYPTTRVNYEVKSKAPTILSYQNQSPFLSGLNNFYCFSAPLSPDYSNFTASPLIVPTLYNMGAQSLKIAELYHLIGTPSIYDVPISLDQDQVLRIVQKDEQFIPQQQSFGSKVRLSFDAEINNDGIYTLLNEQQTHGHIAFNFSRTESQLNYPNLNYLNEATVSESIPELFSSLEKDNSVEELWKWFVILALSLLLIEILIQKLL